MKDKKNILGINKQLSSSSTTKLAMLSIALLLAVFCTIGMSFTPAEEGENIVTPNDSTYVTGPRRSHWTIPGDCGGTEYRNQTDYAEVHAQVIVWNEDEYRIKENLSEYGSVTLSGDTIEGKSGGYSYGASITQDAPNEPSENAVIKWNSSNQYSQLGNTDEAGEDIIKNRHTLKVEVKANVAPESDYEFYGWTRVINGEEPTTKPNTLYNANPEIKESIIIGGGGDGFERYGTSENKSYQSEGSPYKVVYYAHFAPPSPQTITLKATENGAYTYDDGAQSERISNKDDSITTSKQITLTANPASGYKFFGWYEKDGDQEKYLSYESPWSQKFTVPTTIYAKFIPANWATYIVRNKPEVRYYNFQAAADAAYESTDKVFLPIIDGDVPAGSYTIPSGVTLLVPYESTNKVNTNAPDFVEDGNTAPSKFRELKLTEGVSIEVNGSICVNAKLRDRQNSNGAQNGKCGIMNMNAGSTITLNDGANLYCWGIIHGDGEITAKKGSFVYESFQVNDYPGGTWLSGNVLNGSLKDHGVFPIRIYCFPNIQSKLHLECGATEKVATAFANLGLQKDVVFISSDAGLFIQKSGSVITKWYDKENDLQQFQVKGEVNLKSVELKVATLATINSANFILPITHNMHIELLKGSTANITENIAFLPSAKVVVNEGATVNINSGKMIHVYDTAQWKNNYTYAAIATNAATNKNNFSIVYNRAAAKKRSYLKNDLSDAVFEVNGTINIQGALYTTSSGANICSTGAGKVIFDGINAPDSSKAHQVEQGSSTNATYRDIPITPAKLHNDTTIKNPTKNPTYTLTSDADAGDEFWYIKSLGRWVKNEFGPELDIVDADNTKKTLTINANGWASSGWPYTISGTPYAKTARQADRTLVIPYTGTSGASLPIAVLDTDGKPICRHIYKVPFVYTGTEDMSAMNENSIVFVKSGTLTIEDNISAKEIYVAPGAELEVTGTLTVGKLVLRTTPWQSAVLTNNGTINGQVYYSRISPDSKQYYQFGLPLSCELDDVKMSNTDKLGGSQPKYGTAWMLKSYNEKSRANNGISSEGANWDSLPSNGTITAGVGYEMFSNSNYYREFYFPVTLPAEPTTTVSVSYTPDGAEGAAHAGWNIITSPLTSKATVTIGDPATAIKVCWLQADGTYKQEQPTVIPPAIPFSYQASAGDKELNFSVSSTAAAPRKQSAAEALIETEWVHLDIFDAYGEGDETSLFVHPTRFKRTYKTGIDVAKQSLTAARPIIYSTHVYGDMAFAGIADSLLENGIDLVVYSPAEQKLTFSLRENKFLHRLEYLWLADNETGARTDLLMDDYTCRADAGTAKGRFVLNGRFKAPQIATGIDNTQTDYNIYAIGNNIAISGVEQGTPIYVFDAVGHMIYNTSATSDEVIVPAPCAGVYMLTIGGQTAKLVINK